MAILIAALGAFSAAVLLANTVWTGIIARRAVRNAAILAAQHKDLGEIKVAINGRLDTALAELESAHSEIARITALLEHRNLEEPTR